MKKIISLVFILFAIVVINSCRQDEYIPNVCYKQTIQPLLVSKCATSGCHNPKDMADGYDFTTYEGTLKAVKKNKALQSELYFAVRGKDPKMPKGGTPLTDKEVDYIKHWINFGAENSNCGNTACDSASYITYNNTVKDIIASNCLGCHPTFNSFSTVSSNASTINTRINLPLTTAGHMPQGYSLSACDIAKIQKWINLGKPE